MRTAETQDRKWQCGSVGSRAPPLLIDQERFPGGGDMADGFVYIKEGRWCRGQSKQKKGKGGFLVMPGTYAVPMKPLCFGWV